MRCDSRWHSFVKRSMEWKARGCSAGCNAFQIYAAPRTSPVAENHPKPLVSAVFAIKCCDSAVYLSHNSSILHPFSRPHPISSYLKAMRFFSLAVIAATTVTVNALNCTQQYTGGLKIYKNSFPTSQPDFAGYPGVLVNGTLTAGKSPSFMRLLACDDQTVTFPGSGLTVILKVVLQVDNVDPSGPPNCITRIAPTGALELRPCATDDASVEPQLWQATLFGWAAPVRDIMPYTKGRYPHLSGGKFYRESCHSRILFVLSDLCL